MGLFTSAKIRKGRAGFNGTREVERFGSRESFRVKKKARRVSTESPLRDKSAITVFQDERLVWSTYLLNQVVRLALIEVEYCFPFATQRNLSRNELYIDIFIHSYTNYQVFCYLSSISGFKFLQESSFTL